MNSDIINFGNSGLIGSLFVPYLSTYKLDCFVNIKYNFLLYLNVNKRLFFKFYC